MWQTSTIDLVSEPKPIAKVDQLKTPLDKITPQLVQPYPEVTHAIVEGTTQGIG